MRPSQLLIETLGRSPNSPNIASKAGLCALCGHPYASGDPVAPFYPGKSFSDFPNMLGSGNTICGWCSACLGPEFLKTYTKTVVSPEGFFQCASYNEIAYWMLNPPEPPFMMFMGDQRSQHLVWRTPVNLGRELFFFRLGEKVLSARPAMMKVALESARVLSAALTQNRQINGKGRPAAIKSPFLSSSPEYKNASGGLLSHYVYELAEKDEALLRHIDNLNSLTAGENWAMQALIYAANPQKPECRDVSTKTQKDEK